MAQKILAQSILDDLLRANAKKGESTRKDLTRQNGQIMAISMGTVSYTHLTLPTHPNE